MSLYAMRYRAASGTRHTHHILASSMAAAYDTAFDIAELQPSIRGFSVQGLAAA
ncbi:hypothetical protein ACFIQF_11540 [Comamonas sp. J-3]|uniref:hypothetical protein n=1 Tax=Comamonas trifloxystrobinivorans TaxID=3350256 RepID=UPI00372B0D33